MALHPLPSPLATSPAYGSPSCSQLHKRPLLSLPLGTFSPLHALHAALHLLIKPPYSPPFLLAALLQLAGPPPSATPTGGPSFQAAPSSSLQ
ncbi:hypothetical protein GOP47_0015907 [Adiantum capillus-veneris]|uniref:Uncharacterized protein n=1 Tax=Adiantum capillus-veneris TaxID=13818 RepID=A0A9D4UKL8_ADICA|nr:hypothetical protein GOP47_0015907 [Adiantum capillus-veneris]